MRSKGRIVSRASDLPLLAALVLTLTGCAGLPEGPRPIGGAETDGYRGSETVVVLLPESGRFAGAAQAVRDGILAAQGADEQGRRPRLVFRDSGDGSDPAALVRAAVAEGATHVIGPLQKEGVERLAGEPGLPVPVLALNRAGGGALPPANLYQFALAPEDEAAAAADKAWEAGRRSALMLYPASAWGERIAGGFRARWGALSGGVISGVVYEPDSIDLSRAVNTLLGPAEASAADVLFLVATAERAREILPLVRERAGDRLAVFTTSHAHDTATSALAGLYYVDIPWLISPAAGGALSYSSLRARLPDFQDQYARLYAMGIDAYRLAPRLADLARRPGATFDGKTGVLSLDAQRQVKRRLTLARIEADGPVAVAAVSAPGSERRVARRPTASPPRLAASGTYAAARP
jgi:hypothetical protein